MKVDLKAILAKHSPNYKLGLTSGVKATTKGTEALDAMKEVWNLAVETCHKQCDVISAYTYHPTEEYVIAPYSIEQLKI